MAEPWEEAVMEIVAVAEDALRGYVEVPAVRAFTRSRAEQFAREHWMSLHAASAEERERHRTELEVLCERVRPDFNALHLGIDPDAKNTVIRVYETIGGMLRRVFPKLKGAS